MKLAIVLSGGGARAAYQVGVLKYLIEKMPHLFQPTIFCGTSAGAINALFLAQHMDSISTGVRELERTWAALSVGDIFDVPDLNLSKLGMKVAYDAFRGQLWKNLSEFQAVFDTRPLAHLLSRIVDMDKIHGYINDKSIDALTVTTTEYGTGKAVIFLESHHKHLTWNRVQRESRNVQLTIQHIVASAAIPMLFPAIPIDGVYYGDGSMRDKSPFSPPAKLGADKILAIGVRSLEVNQMEPARKYPSIASIGGTLADSIFVDALDSDYEHLSRINKIIAHNKLPSYKNIEALFIRPSMDLGASAVSHIREIPPMIRRVFQGFGSSDSSSSGFLSYLLFAGGYARDLMRMGYEDGRRNHAQLESFLTDDNETSVITAA